MRLVVTLITLLALVPAALLVAGATFTRDTMALMGAASAGAYGAAGLLLPGAARISGPAEVLRHDVRRRIHEHLRDGSGATLTQLTSALDLTATNALWHLRKLENANLVRSRRFHGSTLYYASEGGIQQQARAVCAAALNVENARVILRVIADQPGIHQRELARTLDVNPGTVRWHLRKLVDAGVVEEHVRGATRAYYVTPAGRGALTQPLPVEAPALARG